MIASEQIRIEYKINELRLELIKLISEINHVLSFEPEAIRSKEYKEIKSKYYLKKEELQRLRSQLNDSSGNKKAA